MLGSDLRGKIVHCIQRGPAGKTRAAVASYEVAAAVAVRHRNDKETITFCGTIYRDFGNGQAKISNAGLLALKKSTFGRKMDAQLLLDKV